VSRQAVDPQAFDLAARLAAQLPLEELRVVVERVEAGEGVMPPASRRPSPRGSVAFQTVDEVLGAVEARLITRDQGTQLLAVPPRRRPLAGAAVRIVTTPALAGDGGGLMSPAGQAERTRA
jgi:hypothetical protein